ncbi:pyridoxamine 5'-phosphate oxidase family protein [Aliihoeflea sp. 2WW]|uniref:pyridoxamine 5'-phosphate oxidase family protein n=1 Tax=Aliihoeflea sp. 2WW TaxID=1381123 RepID=UPI000465A377|nr:pyridoxamine 5'-phosphate oxidase family protein [Aliihoeflea sp. 2WW]
MPAKSLSDLSDKMREIDIAMLMTRTDGGAIAGRPMSNNGDVEYDGDSYYFTMSDARMVADIEADPNVSLAFQGDDMFMVAVQGKGEIVRDKAAFEDHWNPDLDDWFEDGVDTEGLVMIKVSAERVHYWDGEENGEVKL